MHVQSIDRCFPGPGPARDRFDRHLAATAAGLERLRQAHRDGSLPLLRLPERTDDLAAAASVAAEFRQRFDHVLVLGMGGSTLGGKALHALADQGFGPPPGTPRLTFLDSIDPATFVALERALDPARTGIVAISKSGSTAETLSQLLHLLDWLGDRRASERVVAIAEPTDNPLRRLAERLGARSFDHDPKVGGRYSVLSLVGLLPALIAGLDAGAVRAGAAAVWGQVARATDPASAPPAVGAALAAAAADAGLGITVLMPYADRLAEFGLWYRQLWAESLGKQGKGTTPIRAMGPVDQHSQLQLYLEGPADKLYTVVTVASGGQGRRLDPSRADDPRLAYLAGRTVGDLLAAEARATVETLSQHGRPVRTIALPRLDEAGFGALFMQFMLETILTADLIGVDPFDQPAVESGKVLARQFLAQPA